MRNSKNVHRNRIIPVLLLKGEGVYKSIGFKKFQYVGDPINAVKIFNEKEVDELIIIDTQASKQGSNPNYGLIKEIASEAFMPLAYGGGIKSLEQVNEVMNAGIEKVVVNNLLFDSNARQILHEISYKYGEQSIVLSLDIYRNLWGKYFIYDHAKGSSTGLKAIDKIIEIRDYPIGELFVNSVNNDGKYTGYDFKLLEMANKNSTKPVIICGGASSKNDFVQAHKNGASGCAAGSYFVFQRPHQAVLITYDI